VAAKPVAVKAVAAKPAKPVFTPAGGSKNPAAKVVGGIGSVEWGGVILAVLLFAGVFTLSTCVPIGILINYYTTREENWLRYAARCGLGFAVLVLMAGFMLSLQHHSPGRH
jgi:hypothetical protein